MSYVVVNALSIPAEQAQTLDQRFAARAGSVDQSPGFEHFELLRPVSGTAWYLVYTRWDSQGPYQQWLDSRDFSAGHGGGRPAASVSARRRTENNDVRRRLMRSSPDPGR